MNRNISPIISPQQEWEKKFPAVISGILSVFQLVITIIIIGCEVGSVLIDIVTATIYVGFWAGLFFMIAWISVASASCCCRMRGCATYALVIQIISLFFAACVIGFDAYCLINPSICFFPSYICSSSAPTRGLFYTNANFYNIKMPLIKGQLAAGAVMFVLCLIYIFIYVTTNVQVHRANITPSIYQETLYALPRGPDGMITAPPVKNIRPLRTTSPLYHRPTMVIDNGEGRTNDLLCPTCSTTMAVTVRKRSQS